MGRSSHFNGKCQWLGKSIDTKTRISKLIFHFFRSHTAVTVLEYQLLHIAIDHNVSVSSWLLCCRIDHLICKSVHRDRAIGGHIVVYAWLWTCIDTHLQTIHKSIGPGESQYHKPKHKRQAAHV